MKKSVMIVIFSFLKEEIENLFIKNWNRLKTGDYVTTPQNKSLGSYHRHKEFEIYHNFLPKGWNTEVEYIKCLKEPI